MVAGATISFGSIAFTFNIVIPLLFVIITERHVPSAWAEEDRNRRIDIIFILYYKAICYVTRVSCDINYIPG